ncbi:Uncharacterised protein [uncultured archaeon]|nr:Uncharacterised protein [uncultured archaeon]
MDAQLQKIRPVRLYADSAKTFDGFIKAPNYRFKGNNKNNFSAIAVSWDKELSEIIINEEDNANYIDQTIDYVFGKLIEIANNYGMTKKAIYAYDTSKLPYHDAGVFGTLITRDFTGNSVWSAFQDITQALDIYETLHIGEWAIKIDALQSEYYIYVIPQMLNTDQPAAKTYKNFQLAAGKTLEKDYTRLLNYCEVYGVGNLKSASLRTIVGQESTTQILIETNIPTNTEEFYATNQPAPVTAAERRYLRVTINNPTGSDKTGNVMINGGDGAIPPNEIHERFFLEVPAGKVRYHFTNNRFYTLSGGALHAFEVNGFSGCKITVDECTFAFAGRSINAYGVKSRALLKSKISTQADVDAYAIQQVRMYHAPLVKSSFELLPAWIDYTDLIGKTVNIYDEFEAAQTDFFCARQEYKFQGAGVHETLTLQRYNYSWEFMD